MNFADASAVNESPPLEAAQLSDRYPGPVTDVLDYRTSTCHNPHGRCQEGFPSDIDYERERMPF